MKLLIRAVLLGLVWSCVSSCGTLLNHPAQASKARLGEETQTSVELKSIPPAKDPVVVAVYKFRDQTGQYKPAENGSSWSTAVTQGATSILIRALEDSGWFVPIERENVGNLLNERKIIRSSRAQYDQNNNKQLLPPLLYAGVILEGGVISYDANVITGGAGLRYFGAGGSGQYRQDRVTVYLRAISTSNGKILKTVYTSKMILSQAVDVGLFRFVRFSRLLEAETGFTYNEPVELALTEAIEKAVQSLIIEGVLGGLWELKSKSDLKNDMIKNYKEEKNNLPKADILGQELGKRRRKMAFHMGTASVLYKGDYPNSVLKTGMEFGLTYSSSAYLGWSFNYGFNQMSAQKYYTSNITYLEFNPTYRLLPHHRLSPFMFGGLGLITQNIDSRFDLSNRYYPKINIGAGIEWMVSRNIGLRASIDYNGIMSDNIDDVAQGRYNDFYYRGNLGVNFYFGKPLKGPDFKYKRNNLKKDTF